MTTPVPTEHSGLHPKTTVRMPLGVLVLAAISFAGSVWAGAAAWFSTKHEIEGVRSQLGDVSRRLDGLIQHQREVAAGFQRRMRAARVECPPRSRRAGTSTLERCRVVFVEGPEEPDGKGESP